jgi:hypothetical protein
MIDPWVLSYILTALAARESVGGRDFSPDEKRRLLRGFNP